MAILIVTDIDINGNIMYIIYILTAIFAVQENKKNIVANIHIGNNNFNQNMGFPGIFTIQGCVNIGQYSGTNFRIIVINMHIHGNNSMQTQPRL